jgi:hypothetical protein
MDSSKDNPVSPLFEPETSATGDWLRVCVLLLLLVVARMAGPVSHQVATAPGRMQPLTLSPVAIDSSHLSVYNAKLVLPSPIGY